MKIAFIILAHKHPAQLERLLRKLAHPEIDCYVHVDAKSDLEVWQQALSLPRVYTVHPRVDIKWAGYSMVEATLHSMQAVRDSGNTYAYITMLSGQDYVIKTAGHIHHFLTQPSDRQYIGLIDDQTLQKMMSKMNEYHLVEYNFPGRFRLAKLFTRLMPSRKAPLDMRLYSGSQWWTLTQDCVNFLLDHIRQHPSISRFFKFTWGADEFIFQTILMNSRYRDAVTGYDLHYIDWSAGTEHPKTLGMEDVDKMIGSKLLVARKFDMEKDPELLDLIDERLSRPINEGAAET